MPLYVPGGTGGGGGGAVTVDAAGFITIAGSTSLPFKDVEEDMGGGIIRVQHVVLHPTLGEVVIGFAEKPAP